MAKKVAPPPAPSEAAPKRKRLPASQRRLKIIEAAREVFLQEGMGGARTKDIAERAGVTEAFLYRYFDSKDAMYEAAVLDPVRQGIASLTADVERIHAEVADPIEFIHQVNKRCLEYYLDYARLQSVALFAELTSGREFYANDLQPNLDKMGRLIADHSGWSMRGLDPRIVRRAAFGAQFVIGLDHALRGDHADVDDLARKLTVLFTGGIKEKQRKSGGSTPVKSRAS
jgi:AcrR family transcriptional regulator